MLTSIKSLDIYLRDLDSIKLNSVLNHFLIIEVA